MEGKLQYLRKDISFHDITEETEVNELQFKEIAEQMFCELPEINFEVLRKRIALVKVQYLYYVKGKTECENRIREIENQIKKIYERNTTKPMTLNDLINITTCFETHYKTNYDIYSMSVLKFYTLKQRYNNEIEAINKRQNSRIKNHA